MKNLMLTLAVLLLSACGSENYEERSARFAEELCTYAQLCKGDNDYNDCYRDVIKDMADAKTKLSPPGQEACMKCMEVQIEEYEASSDDSCKEEPDLDRIIEACGPTGDEACAGYP